MTKKPKGVRGYTNRRVNTRDMRPRFLVVCEGEQTEPNYFRRFARPWVTVNVLGLGVGPIRLVERAANEARKPEHKGSRVWCVFDRDEVKAEQFNKAYELAQRKGFAVAYSNPAFELWLLLHFQECRAPLSSRREYIERLSQHLPRPYEKSDRRMFDRLEALQPAAIRRAAELLSTYEPCSPCHDDPSTTVHRCV